MNKSSFFSFPVMYAAREACFDYITFNYGIEESEIKLRYNNKNLSSYTLTAVVEEAFLEVVYNTKEGRVILIRDLAQ